MYDGSYIKKSNFPPPQKSGQLKKSETSDHYYMIFRRCNFKQKKTK